VFWTFGVLALTKYVFASFFTAEFTNWAFRLTPELRQRITQLQWESPRERTLGRRRRPRQSARG
jgi:hypothetical protein